MPEVIIAPRARIDINHIFDTVAEGGGKRTAARFVARIEKKIMGLAYTPHTGRPMPHLSPSLRLCVAYPYLIFYRVTDKAVEIVRIFHGHRNITPDMFV